MRTFAVSVLAALAGLVLIAVLLATAISALIDFENKTTVSLSAVDDAALVERSGGRVVVVAARDIPAGETVHANAGTLRVLPATEVGPGAFTDRRDVSGHIATVDIPAGQPLTPELMEPLAE